MEKNTEQKTQIIMEGNFQLIPPFPSEMTRTMYCPKCAQNQMPDIGNFVYLLGTTSRTGYVFSVKRDNMVNEFGFTPHIISQPNIILNKEGKIIVRFYRTCCMHACGMFINFKPFSNSYVVDILNRGQAELPLNEFIALINYKDHSYYLGS